MIRALARLTPDLHVETTSTSKPMVFISAVFKGSPSMSPMNP